MILNEERRLVLNILVFLSSFPSKRMMINLKVRTFECNVTCKHIYVNSSYKYRVIFVYDHIFFSGI